MTGRTRAINRSYVSDKGHRAAYLARLARRIRIPPVTFDARDIEQVIGISEPRAQVIGSLLVREGFARFHFEKVPHRRRHAKKIFERL